MSTIQAHFHRKIMCFCMHFSALLYEKLFLLFHCFIIIVRHFSNSHPPVYFDPPIYQILEFILTPLFIRTPLFWHLRELLSKLTCAQFLQGMAAFLTLVMCLTVFVLSCFKNIYLPLEPLHFQMGLLMTFL